MQAPSAFVEQLEREFGGRYRIRWSDRRQEWHLEQKAETGNVDEPPPLNEFREYDTLNDGYLRARDGYWFVMAVRTGDRMPCPAQLSWTGERCGSTVKVPIMETREAVCERCRLEGRDGRVTAAFFPLNDILIQHLRRIDAHGTHKDHITTQQDINNEFHKFSMDQQQLNEIDAYNYENRKRIGGVEQVGYGGSIIRPVV